LPPYSKFALESGRRSFHSRPRLAAPKARCTDISAPLCTALDVLAELLKRFGASLDHVCQWGFLAEDCIGVGKLDPLVSQRIAVYAVQGFVDTNEAGDAPQLVFAEPIRITFVEARRARQAEQLPRLFA